MAISKGAAKVVAYKKETNWGELPTASGAKQLRRVSAAFNLNKATNESAEIRTDRQDADFRHGVKSVDGSVNGEVSTGSYSDFMQSLLAKDFVAVSLGAAVSVTVATSNGISTITRTTGSFLTSGFQPGMVVRGTGFTASGDNSKNLLILTVTALAITVETLDGSAMAAQATASSVTFTVPGKQTIVPSSGFTEDSYAIEEWYSDIAQSEVYTGCKVGSMSVQLPSSGMSTIDFSFMGKNLTRVGTTQYFTSPAAQGTQGVLEASGGAMIVNGVPVALITSADFSVERAMENATAVGSNSITEIFSGRIRVSGNLSLYFQDATFRDYFVNETEVSLVMALTDGSAANAGFISFTLPRVKINSFTKDDTELGLTASASFKALLNSNTSGGLPATTIAIQDSSVV